MKKKLILLCIFTTLPMIFWCSKDNKVDIELNENMPLDTDNRDEDEYSNSEPEDVDKLYIYENKTNNFKIDIPKKWTFEENTHWFNCLIYTPQNDNIKENLWIYVKNLSKNDTLEELLETTITELIDTYNVEIISNSYTKINWETWTNLIYSFKDWEYEIQSQQTTFIIWNKIYIFQYTATKNTFNKFSDEINYIISSFKLLD